MNIGLQKNNEQKNNEEKQNRIADGDDVKREKDW